MTIAKCKKNMILPGRGTPVRTKIKKDMCTGGFLVKQEDIDSRRNTSSAVYWGCVPGASGDVWWIKHKDSSFGAYMTNEVFDTKIAGTAEEKRKKKVKRLNKANKVIEIISSYGHGFFTRNGARSRFELDKRGRVWFIDKYNKTRIYLHNQYWDRGFTEGGTLRDVVNSLFCYIQNNKEMNLGHFGPWEDWICDGDPWGYGKDNMKKVKEEIKELMGEDQP